MNEPLDPSRWVYLSFAKGTRCYAASLTQSLFGEWLVERRWGGTRRRGGQALVIPAASYGEAVAILAAVIVRRGRRGYREVEN